MVYTIHPPHRINTSIQLPASKSISNRALILNALSKSAYPIENLSDSDDTHVLWKALQSDGAHLDVGAAGTSMRFLTAYLSQVEGIWTITGTERMKNRPIKLLVDALRELGAEIDYQEKEGYPPLKIQGKRLTGGSISLNGSVSSQYISALMMIAPAMEKGLTIRLEGHIISKPYIKMTRQLLADFGVQALWEEPVITIVPQNYRAQPCRIESDWSAASYWYEVMALCEDDSSVELLGLTEESVQGDAAIVSIFKNLGVSTVFTDSGVLLSKSSGVQKTFQYNFVNEPDLAQTVVVTCCLLNIPFCFTGLQSLRIKETDRITALQVEMRKLGYILNDKNDSVLEWTGERCESWPIPLISTYEDHRMAMAFAPACLKTETIQIEDPEVVSKSYPNYWRDLKTAGFDFSDKTGKTVCMISCSHHLLDDRIYKKEALTLAQNGYTVIHIGYGDAVEDYYTEDKIRVIQLKKLRKGTSLRSQINTFRQIQLNDLFLAAKSVSADVYHLHDVELCRIALKLKKLPQQPHVVYDSHEPFNDNLKDYWRERSLAKVLLNDIPAVLAEKRILKQVDYLIATEENVAARFRKQNPHTAIVYNYSYFKPLEANQKTSQPLKEYDVVYCGSVSKSKGIFLMLNAVIAAKKRGYNLKVAVVGSFSDAALQLEVNQIIQTEQLADHFVFTGELPLEEVSYYYERSKTAFCLFPKNRTNQLILPIKLFEYAAFGLPIIGSNFGHIAEIIQSNGIGLCVNPHNAEEVASALIELITDDHYKEYIPLCLNCVKTKYVWENQEAKLLGIYEELLNLH